MYKKILTLTFLITLCHEATSQSITPLERIVSITFENESVDGSLSKLGREAGCNFSYNPSILDANQRITSTHSEESVREILNSFFAETIETKVKWNYVILTKAPPRDKA